MSLGVASLIAVLTCVVLGFVRRTNVGILAIGSAYVIGTAYGMSAREIAAGWPTQLFILLAGVTFLFGLLEANGSLAKIALRVVWLCRLAPAMLLPAFFCVSATLAGVGPGNIAVCAVMLPLASNVAKSQRRGYLALALMVITGANIGGLSPLAPTGIVAMELSRGIGVDGGLWLFRDMAIYGGAVAVISLGVLATMGPGSEGRAERTVPATPRPLSLPQIVCLTVATLAVAAIMVFGLHVGMTALIAGSIIILLYPELESKAIGAMPWSTLLLISGVAALLNVATETGGVSIMSDVFSSLMSPAIAGSVMAAMAGFLSMVSSASGVVMPTLIPTVPFISENLGEGVGERELISSIVIGAHMVTISPVSTLGAMALLSAPASLERMRLFGQLLSVALLSLGVYAVVLTTAALLGASG